ncbi:MAG TPA: hypothetical protein PKK88_05510 [Bacteroidales bacterium]|nr:hypothetical protein [Bacteroidales bacterium]
MTRTKFKVYQIDQITAANIDQVIADAAIAYDKLANFFGLASVDWTSDTSIASAKAIKALIDASVAGLWDNRGIYDASGNAFPTTGGSGASGAILKSDVWVISVAGTLGTKTVDPGDVLIALSDTPGQTASNWNILEFNLGYTPQQELTAAVMGALIAAYAGEATPADTNEIVINVGGTAKKMSFTTLKAFLKTYFDTVYGSGTGDMVLASAQVVTASKTFVQNTLKLKGSSTGTVTLSTDVATATNYTQKFQAKDGNVALLEDTFNRHMITLTATGEVGNQTTTLDANLYDEVEKGMLIYINGQLQTYGSDYTVSGTTITWTAYNTDSIDLTNEIIRAYILKKRS